METKKYNCINCGFFTNLTADYNRHILTKKHLKKMNTDIDYAQEYDNLKAKYDSLQNNSNDKLLALETKINDLNQIVEETNVLLEQKNEIQHHDNTKKNLYESNDAYAHMF
jgi:hypothetical protein